MEESTTENILVIGASSAIAREVCRLYAARKCSLFITARNAERLEVIAKDLKVRGAGRVGTAVLDVNNFDMHQSTIDQALDFLQRIDIALICHGTLPDQPGCQDDVAMSLTEISTNGTSIISLLTLLGKVFQTQGSGGSIAVVTSVAGDRGRASNYVYGAAKAMVSTFLEGFRGMLLPYNVNVVDIKPGFVDTPMTAHIEKKGALWAHPEDVATVVVKSIDRRKSTVYVPYFWRFIMLTVSSVPTFIFKRLKF